MSGKRIAWRRNQEAKPSTHLLFILLLKSTGQDGIWTRNSHGRPPHRFLYKMENCPAIPPDLSRSGYHSSLVNTVNPRPLHLQGQHRASRVVVKVKCGGEESSEVPLQQAIESLCELCLYSTWMSYPKALWHFLMESLHLGKS